MQLIESILADAASIATVRRDIHAHPELCFKEVRTAVHIHPMDLLLKLSGGELLAGFLGQFLVRLSPTRNRKRR